MQDPLQIKYPVLLKVICLISGTYHFTYFIFLLLLSFIPKTLEDTANNYFGANWIPIYIYILIFSGIVLTLFTFLGIILIWRHYKVGFYIYLIASIIIVTLQLFLNYTNWISIVFNLLFISLFSIFNSKFKKYFSTD